ncbi:MAG: molybdenum ABC transporter ATP-binding protein [Pseudomonadota bacterium]
MTLEVTLCHRVGAFELDIAFTAPAGVTALFGRSGAGKSSVVNAVAGLFRPKAGRIVLNGRPLFDAEAGIFVPPHRRRMGYAFQDGRLFPHLSVRQNLCFAPGGKRPLDEVATLLGLTPLLDRRPRDLSGGEKSRVAMGRALMCDAEMLLLDEPMAALDTARKAEILPYLDRICQTSDLPVLYVSHALPEVAQLARTLIVLRDGRVSHAGPVADLLSDPEALPAIGGRAAVSVLRGHIAAHFAADDLTEVALSGGRLLLPRIALPIGRTVTLRIAAREVIVASTRPEGLSALNVLPATVTAVREGSGPGATLGLAIGRDVVLARITRRSLRALALSPGSACYAILKSTSIAPDDVIPETGGDGPTMDPRSAPGR